jgi:hypothetical protein
MVTEGYLTASRRDACIGKIAMRRTKLGTTGLHIAPLVLGGNVFGWTLDESASLRILDAFVDHGWGPTTS